MAYPGILKKLRYRDIFLTDDSFVIKFTVCSNMGSFSIPSYCCRFVLKPRSGSVSVVRAYVSAATTMEERTGAMANISAAQSIGFIVGPGEESAHVECSIYQYNVSSDLAVFNTFDSLEYGATPL